MMPRLSVQPNTEDTMKVDEIIKECVERKKVTPTKTAAEVVSEVMAEIAEIKAEMRKRPEFSLGRNQ